MRILVLVAIVALGLAGCGDTPPPAAGSRPRPLIERAIDALGGRERLAAIRSMDVHSVGDEQGRAYASHVQVAMPDSFRSDLETTGARFTQASSAGRAWASVEGLAIPVGPDELRSIRQSWRLGHLTLLVTLDPGAGVKLKEAGRRGDDDTLEVTFPDDPRGPFVLGFNPVSALLRSVEWDAEFVGTRGSKRTRVEFSDWKAVDAIMVPFRARFFTDGEFYAEDRVEIVVFNSAVPPSRFAEPPTTAPDAELVIDERRVPEIRVAVLAPPGTEMPAADALSSKVDAWINDHGMIRNGPVIRLQPMAENHAPGVAIPVQVPDTATRPSTRPAADETRLTVLPATAVLTAALWKAEPAARSAAIAKLAGRARERGLEIDGPCRIVLWSREITQLELPVRVKKG